MSNGSFAYTNWIFQCLVAEGGPALVQRFKCYIMLTEVNVEAPVVAAVVEQQVTTEEVSFITQSPPNQSKVLQSRLEF